MLIEQKAESTKLKAVGALFRNNPNFQMPNDQDFASKPQRP
jgi:hypothetical protein